MDSEKQHAVDVHTRQAEEFDQRYKHLKRDPYNSTFTYGRQKVEGVLDAEIKKLPAGSRILDVGCGTGFTIRRLRESGYMTVGVEPSEGMRARAIADNPGAEIVDGDVEALPFPAASFDGVVSIEVIRYLSDPSKGLAEMARILRPGGVAVITAAPLLSLNGYALINAVTSRMQIPTFTRVKHSFMTEKQGRRAMLAAGFTSVEVHGRFLGPWHALARLSAPTASAVMRFCEPLDDLLSDRWPFRDLSNHLILVGRR